MKARIYLDSNKVEEGYIEHRDDVYVALRSDKGCSLIPWCHIRDIKKIGKGEEANINLKLFRR